VKSIPGCCEKPFAFRPGTPFTFSPESCSPSPRNVFHVPAGIAFTLPRNPHHVSKRMLKHYSHIRMEAKRRAVASLIPDDKTKTESAGNTGAKVSPQPFTKTKAKVAV
jgi:hypothetical protein